MFDSLGSLHKAYEALGAQLFDDAAIWSFQNLREPLNHHSKNASVAVEIHGPLAQILKTYPKDYHLKFLGFETH